MTGRPCPYCNKFVQLCECEVWECGWTEHLDTDCPSERAIKRRARNEAKAKIRDWKDGLSSQEFKRLIIDPLPENHPLKNPKQFANKEQVFKALDKEVYRYLGLDTSILE